MRRLRQALSNSWREIDKARIPAAPITARPVVILVSATIFLTVAMWFGHRGVFLQYFVSYFDPRDRFFGLYPELWWAGINIFCYLVAPMLVVRLAGWKLSDFGLNMKGFWRHLRTYLILYLCVVPLIVIASSFENFRNTYPFSKEVEKGIAQFVIFEAAYFVQFLAIEFFFRGYLLFGLERHLGVLSIPVMLMPYALIHLGKPFAEGLGTLIAGTVLGTLALRTRSIAGGVLIHYAVALTMDLVALGQKGQLF